MLRQAFRPTVTDQRIIAQFESTLAELKAAGAEIVDPFEVPVLDTVPRPPQTSARFKDDMTVWIEKHPGVPYPSVRAIAESKLVHPLHQALMDEAAAALPVAEDRETIEGLRNEQLWRDGFAAAMDAGRIDAVVLPTWAQLPRRFARLTGAISTSRQPWAKSGQCDQYRSSVCWLGAAHSSVVV